MRHLSAASTPLQATKQGLWAMSINGVTIAVIHANHSRSSEHKPRGLASIELYEWKAAFAKAQSLGWLY